MAIASIAPGLGWLLETISELIGYVSVGSLFAILPWSFLLWQVIRHYRLRTIARRDKGLHPDGEPR